MTNYPDGVTGPIGLTTPTTFCASAVVNEGTCVMEACTTVSYGDNIITLIKEPASGDTMGFVLIETEGTSYGDTIWGQSTVEWVAEYIAGGCTGVGAADTYYVTVSEFEHIAGTSNYYHFSHWNDDITDTIPSKFIWCTTYNCTLKAVYDGPTPVSAGISMSSGMGDTLIIVNTYPTNAIMVGDNYLAISNSGELPIVIGFRYFDLSVRGDTCWTLRMANSYLDYIGSFTDCLGLEALLSDSSTSFDEAIYRVWINNNINWANTAINPSDSIYIGFKFYTPRDYTPCYRLLPSPRRATIGLKVYYSAGLP